VHPEQYGQFVNPESRFSLICGLKFSTLLCVHPEQHEEFVNPGFRFFLIRGVKLSVVCASGPRPLSSCRHDGAGRAGPCGPAVDGGCGRGFDSAPMEYRVGAPDLVGQVLRLLHQDAPDESSGQGTGWSVGE
jgi:hypothetical protein